MSESEEEDLPVDGARMPTLGNKAPKFIARYSPAITDAELRRRMALNVRKSPICQTPGRYTWDPYGLIRLICASPPSILDRFG